MIEYSAMPRLIDPVLVCAFQGWNDAAGAATDVIDHLISTWQATQIGAFDPEDYYDYQVNRPVITIDDAGMRQLTWPSTRIYVARPPGALRDVICVQGIEPNIRWRAFTAEILELAETLSTSLLVTLGSLLADVPHSRPMRVTGSASEVDLEDRLGLPPSTYEGPTGILGVINEACAQVDLPTVSYWAAVPHYLPQGPNPKASLGLIASLEDLLDISIELGDLPEEVQAWERGVAELIDEDEDLHDYVRSLEEAHDTAGLPEASGDEIAREFERYLKRRNRPES